MEAEETANKIKMELEAKKIRENRVVEETKVRVELENLQTEDCEKVIQHGISLRRLDQNLQEPVQNDEFRLSAAIIFVPPFDDVGTTQFPNAIERAMPIHDFPQEKWTQLIHSKLTREAQKVFAELSVDAYLNYDTLKTALLLAYERVPEFHRKRFRMLNKFGNETYSNFAFRLAFPFNSWIEEEEASPDIARLKEAMKLEQFTNCLPTEIHRWGVEKRPKLLVDAAKLADEYAVLYKPFHAEQDNSGKSDDRNFSDKPDKTFHKNGGSWNIPSKISS